MDRVANILYADKIISKEEQVIVKYGLEIAGSNVLGFVITLVIGRLFASLLEGLLLWMLLFPLRKYAGGYHAKTKGKCIVISIGLLIIAFSFWNKNVHINVEYLIISQIFCIVIFFMTPVENRNKPLEEVEINIYKHKTRILLIFQELLLAISIIIEWEKGFKIITMCYLIVFIIVMVGKLACVKKKFRTE